MGKPVKQASSTKTAAQILHTKNLTSKDLTKHEIGKYSLHEVFSYFQQVFDFKHMHKDKGFFKITWHEDFLKLKSFLRKCENTPGWKIFEKLSDSQILEHFYINHESFKDPYQSNLINVEAFEMIKCFSHISELTYIIKRLTVENLISVVGGRHKNSQVHFCKSNGELYTNGNLRSSLCQTKHRDRTKNEVETHFNYLVDFED